MTALRLKGCRAPMLIANKQNTQPSGGIGSFLRQPSLANAGTGPKRQRREAERKEVFKDAGDTSQESASSSEAASELSSDAEQGSSDDEISSEDDAENSIEQDSEDDSEDAEDTVDVTLEFYDPKEVDFLGLKTLLQSYLDGQEYAASELVDTIIQQSSVGTVVKAGDEEDPIGVLTALNTRRYESLKSLGQIRYFILKHCKHDEAKFIISKAWKSESTGFILSERMVNCPPQLGPPLQQALFDEIEWATEDEPTQEKRDSFKLEKFVFLTRVYTDPLPSSKKGKGGKQPKPSTEPPLVFVKPEDEFYHKHCDLSFSFSTVHQSMKDELQPRRLVMLLTKEGIKKARKELDEVIGNAATEAA